jgi:hypothetical protein
MFTVKNILLLLHAIVLSMTLSIVVLPNLWTIQVVMGRADNVTGMVFPLIWTVYAVMVFITSGLTFSWLIKKR